MTNQQVWGHLLFWVGWAFVIIAFLMGILYFSLASETVTSLDGSKVTVVAKHTGAFWTETVLYMIGIILILVGYLFSV